MNMEKDRLYYVQIIVITTLLVYATGLLALPRNVTNIAGTAGWMSIIVGGLIGLLIGIMTANIALQYPDMSFTQICESACGRTFGKVLSLSFFIYTSLILAIGMLQFATTIAIPFLNEMRTEVIVIVSFLVIMYATSKGIGAIARFTFISFAVVFVSLVAIILLSNSIVDTGRLLPLMGRGPVPIFNAGLEAASFFGEVIILLAILKYFPRKNLVKRAISQGIILAMAIMTTIVAACVAIFGTAWVERFAFPMVELAKLVGMGEFFERVEILFLTLWFNTAILKLSLLYYVSVTCLNDLLDLKNYRRLILPYAVFAIGFTLLPDNTVESSTMLAYFREYAIFYALAIVLILTICTKVKQYRKGKRSDTANCAVK